MPSTHRSRAASQLFPPKHPTELPLVDAALEVGDLKLKAGQKLLLCVKAADLCDLDPKAGPNVGNSERWLLDVVSPEQLRAMLEAREVVLRQRFKAIIRDVTETRDLLLGTSFPSLKAGEPKRISPLPTAAQSPARNRKRRKPSRPSGNWPCGPCACSRPCKTPARTPRKRWVSPRHSTISACN